ncbi:MAG: glycine cleavage system protein GcvH [Myxococcales bacterium]|nr:glycine cleavage system protein GcvH [Myxococcales bacterium]USN50128.1 MAG: glycine cleavage system protein GcvH [Myxococcales bacterium]
MTKIIPDDRLFSEEHEWVKIQGDEAIFGISDYAQSCLGDVVYVELPDCGKEIDQGKAIGVVESVKAVSDIFAPLSGTVLAVNHTIIDTPEQINRDPYGEGWMLKIKLHDPSQSKKLLNSKAYEELLEKEAK